MVIGIVLDSLHLVADFNELKLASKGCTRKIRPAFSAGSAVQKQYDACESSGIYRFENKEGIPPPNLQRVAGSWNGRVLMNCSALRPSKFYTVNISATEKSRLRCFTLRFVV